MCENSVIVFSLLAIIAELSELSESDINYAKKGRKRKVEAIIETLVFNIHIAEVLSRVQFREISANIVRRRVSFPPLRWTIGLTDNKDHSHSLSVFSTGKESPSIFERFGRYYYPRLFSIEEECGGKQRKREMESVGENVDEERSGIYSVIKYLLHRSRDDRVSNPR